MFAPIRPSPTIPMRIPYAPASRLTPEGAVVRADYAAPP